MLSCPPGDVQVEERVASALASEAVQHELTGRLERERRVMEAAVEAELQRCRDAETQVRPQPSKHIQTGYILGHYRLG